MQLTLKDWASISTIIGTVLALVAIAYTAYQIGVNRKVNQATFWLELRKMFAEHNEMHLLLRGGAGASPTWGRGEWAKLEAYMGLFEHCKPMLDEGLIDWKAFRNIYEYRIRNIIKDPVIVREKLIKLGEGWPIFLQLMRELGLQAEMLQTGQEWLSSSDGDAWLRSEKGQDWLSTPDGRVWKHMKQTKDAA
jgi:hypothetical protein